jgi:hypothetical protein
MTNGLLGSDNKIYVMIWDGLTEMFFSLDQVNGDIVGNKYHTNSLSGTPHYSNKMVENDNTIYSWCK